MKELSIEQKAKAYDKVLERAKSWYIDAQIDFKKSLETLFPGLKESEDERIRKEIIAFLKENFDTGRAEETWSLSGLERWIAWLEKQGEQKPVDNRLIPQKGKYYVCINDYNPYGKTYNIKGKIYKSPCDGYINSDKGFGLSWTNSCMEAYFSPVKDEDWIVCEHNNVIGEPIQYKEFKEKLTQEFIESLEAQGVTPKLRLWTIKDAKDGDVLVSELSGTIILFKGIENNNIQFYCDYDFSEFDVPGDRFAVNNSGQHYGNVEDSKDIHPASKEQRDLLFTKMKEAGYEWDSENKVLNKIVQKSIKEEAEKVLSDNASQNEENTTTVRLQRIIDFLWKNRKGDTDTIFQQEQDIAWLKSLEPQTAWKHADGDDLPEYDREVIVLTQSYPLENSEFAVSFAHRPNPKGWDGKSIIDGKITHFDVKTYDKGGWNRPNIKYWLDVEFPKNKS